MEDQDQEDENQIIFSIKIKTNIAALEVRHSIEEEMEAKGLAVDGGGMGGGGFDIFVDYKDAKDRLNVIKVGKEVFEKYGFKKVEISG